MLITPSTPPSLHSHEQDGPLAIARRLSREKSLEGRGVSNRRRVVLTTHPMQYSSSPSPVMWGDADPAKRGAVIAALLQPEHRNAIGTHNGLSHSAHLSQCVRTAMQLTTVHCVCVLYRFP